MTTTTSIGDLNFEAQPTQTNGVKMPTRAVIALAAGAIAAWFAAGSAGMLAHPLQHALAWLALAVAILAAWPENNHRFATWIIFAIGIVAAVFLTAANILGIGALAVAIVLAAMAQLNDRQANRLLFIAALSAFVLACFRLACGSIPLVWTMADRIGHLFGWVAGLISGQRLNVGATFGGVDFLVFTASFYVAWLIYMPLPRRRRAIWAAVAILIGHLAYLVLLAYSEKLLNALPEVVLPPRSDINNIGLWTWGNFLRAMIPWNLPLVGMAIHVGIIVVLAAIGPWRPIVEIDPRELQRQLEKEAKEEIPGSVLAKDMMYQFCPTLLAIVAAALVTWAPGDSSLKGKTVVAYEKGGLNWLKPEYNSKEPGLYGMLPVFVQSLGGKFVASSDLSEKDLAAADVLLLIHPNQPWPTAMLDRIWAYVRRGGSLLLVAEPGEASDVFNELLKPSSIAVRDDTAVTRMVGWEQSYAPTTHPTVVGFGDARNRFGIQLGSSLQTGFLAKPLLVGRWGWSDPGSSAALTGVSFYNAGKRLGDLTLVAEQSLGRGRIVVLGDATPLQNDSLPRDYSFVGRMFGYLANHTACPQNLWRQLLALLALAAMIALVAGRPAAWQIMLTASVLGVVLLCCTAVAQWSSRVLPDGRGHAEGFNNLAYIDASHLEAYDSDPHGKHGLLEFARTLMRQGYLPLFSYDLTAERLSRAGLLISIGPGREFSGAESAAVKQFLSSGGTFLCMVGAEQARPITPLLTDLNFTVPPSPVGIRETLREPAPLGAQLASMDKSDRRFGFYAAWPVECNSPDGTAWSVFTDDKGKNEQTIIASLTELGGSVVVIGDTFFAVNENFEPDGQLIPSRILFWRWMLSRIVPGQKPWELPAEKSADKSTEDAS